MSISPVAEAIAIHSKLFAEVSLYTYKLSVSVLYQRSPSSIFAPLGCEDCTKCWSASCSRASCAFSAVIVLYELTATSVAENFGKKHSTAISTVSV